MLVFGLFPLESNRNIPKSRTVMGDSATRVRVSGHRAHDLSAGRLRTSDVAVDEAVTFESLLLAPGLVRGLTESGYNVPSPIQLKAIPLGRIGVDLVAQAKVRSCCGARTSASWFNCSCKRSSTLCLSQVSASQPYTNYPRPFVAFEFRFFVAIFLTRLLQHGCFAVTRENVSRSVGGHGQNDRVLSDSA
jgi:hypothetical protein